MSTYPVRLYRWIVFLLAAGYCLRMIVMGDYGEFAGPFRYLTVWALFLSFFCASRMMAREEGRTTRRFDGMVSMTAVINAMVVFLYWRLFFADPASVTSDGQIGPLYLELYLHLAGPLLQWIDALFIHRSFRRPFAALGWLFGVISIYVVWGELVLQRMNDTPRGTVTTGLPYPFLNNLTFDDRVVFYASNFGVAIVFLLGFAALAWLIRRFLPQPTAPVIRTDSPETAT
ncbi:FAR-17a/AIG1-like protein [Cognatiyoonia koreensis]|uniref:FAR-17a/AIG1-like protein n=1 Tax=Cognatiyoonia koreensis TaxID=364200 RepID=A0A1I0RMP8_9RHOB|nr:hypothetical protein [Cognatiyoonia koreensis]SEW41756.1 FAR-17a/AIG1-like protein [Cognatiyoonia koreensis]